MMKVSTRGNGSTIIASILCVACVAIIVSLQLRHDELSTPFTTKPEAVTRTILPEEILPYVSFGFSNMLADYYWIKTIQDFNVWNGKDAFFIDYFRNITTLDPMFEYPYLFNILVTPQEKDVSSLDTIASIAEKGIRLIPSSWEIPYYLGTQYYLLTKTYEQAAKYLKIAAMNEDAPDGARLLYSSYVTKNIKGGKAAQEMIKVIYNSTDDKVIKALAKKGLTMSSIQQAFEQGIVAYKAKYGKYPATSFDLEKEHFILPPKGFNNLFKVTINQSNGSFKVEER